MVGTSASTSQSSALTLDTSGGSQLGTSGSLVPISGSGFGSSEPTAQSPGLFSSSPIGSQPGSSKSPLSTSGLSLGSLFDKSVVQGSVQVGDDASKCTQSLPNSTQDQTTKGSRLGNSSFSSSASGLLVNSPRSAGPDLHSDWRASNGSSAYSREAPNALSDRLFRMPPSPPGVGVQARLELSEGELRKVVLRLPAVLT